MSSLAHSHSFLVALLLLYPLDSNSITALINTSEIVISHYSIWKNIFSRLLVWLPRLFSDTNWMRNHCRRIESDGESEKTMSHEMDCLFSNPLKYSRYSSRQKLSFNIKKMKGNN